MSATPSQILHQPLCALPLPVAAINQCFSGPSPVSLHLKEKAWTLTDDFSIREATTGKIYFRVEGSALSMTNRKVLLDPNGVPIAHMRKDLLTFMPTFNISADYDSHHLLFRIKAKRMMIETSLECKFRNVMSGLECRVGLFGDWRARAAVIWLDEGNGQKLPVARIYRPTRTERNVLLGAHDFFLDIAPNVDMALMVLICLALEDTTDD